MFKIILKNLFRRKTRTFLTVLGISIGAAAIIGLGNMADGFQAGYSNMVTGSKADFVLSQPDAYDISMSAVDEKIGEELKALPEVADVSGMSEGIVTTDDSPYFFIFGYPEDSFVLSKFVIKSGISLSDEKGSSAKGWTGRVTMASTSMFTTAGESSRAIFATGLPEKGSWAKAGTEAKRAAKTRRAARSALDVPKNGNALFAGFMVIHPQKRFLLFFSLPPEKERKGEPEHP